MKLLFCHNDPQMLQRLVERPLAAQNVVIPCYHGRDLVPLVTSTEPHLVVIGGNKLGATPEELQHRLLAAGFHIKFCILPHPNPSDQALDDIWRSLPGASRTHFTAELDPQEYTVLTEQDFERNESEVVESWTGQENRFLALLAAGAVQHRRAQAYLAAVEATQRHCESDWLAAVLDGNAPAYLWRTQLFRYVSSLAHYVPGVDVECLPLPHPASRKLDYLYTALSGEAYYALCAIRAFGMNRRCDEALWEVGQLQATTDTRLSEDAARLAGWARLLHEIAAAHFHLVDVCLANDPGGLTAIQVTRRTRNQQQIFCRWWNLTDFIGFPERFPIVTKEFHAGRRAEGVPEFDSFFKFAERIQQGLQAEWTSN